MGSGVWSEARRKAQAARIRARKPWLLATGPKTAAGKKRSSRNALKHGRNSAQTRRFNRLLRLQKAYMHKARALTRAYYWLFADMRWSKKRYDAAFGRISGLENANAPKFDITFKNCQKTREFINKTG